MNHRAARKDLEFRRAFEAQEIPAEEFDHEAHVRLAYVYLCEHSVDEAHERMKKALLAYLRHFGVSDTKYHETLTRSWILAVRHFMSRSDGNDSASEFIDANPALLNREILLTHYSEEVLATAEARTEFVEPDIEPIPRH